MKSVNVFAFTNKLKLVMKGHEVELWIASLTTFNFITVQIKTAKFKTLLASFGLDFLERPVRSYLLPNILQ